ncbi:MAG: right-handed parallel beta-helix repeat-containing protein [Clostridia bacterium]|nr:right-handed parallel beta-helix repeat-containing protein [Clostridia bacterium]
MKNYDVKDYGATPDGVTLNTSFIQAAIDDCAKNGGGTVSVEGGVFVSGTLFMRSCVELRIEANATLKASGNADDFPDFDCPEWNVKAAPRNSANCLIYFGYIENASLIGMGKIDCNGSAYCEPVHNEDGMTNYVRKTEFAPARMVLVMGCTNIKIEDVTMFEMAGGWGYWINNSQYVTVSKIKIYCNPHYPNADGVHINCSSDILVEGCVIHSGDDSIIIRANNNTLSKNRVCERVVVKGCVLSTKHQAVRIAWRNDGTIRNCVLSDLVVTDSRVGFVVELPDHSAPTDVGKEATVVENLLFSNIVFDRVEESPIRIIIHPDNLYGRFKNIRFSEVTSVSGDFPQVIGRPDAVPEDIYFDNCKFTVKGRTFHIGKSDRPVPCFRNVKNLCLNNTSFDILYDPVDRVLYEQVNDLV